MYPQRESLPAVTAAGVVAIIFASLGILGCGLLITVMLVMPNFPQNRGAAPPPEAARAMIIGIYAFFFAVCVGELIIAINVLRRKNWARIAMIVWASVMAFFSAVSCIAVFFVLNVMPQTEPTQKDPNFLLFLKVFMLVLYGIPFVVAVWWLILFNRPRVAAAFKTPFPISAPGWSADQSGFPSPYAQAPLAPLTPGKPSCPVPVVIVCAIFLISAAFAPLVFLLPHRSSAPLFLFGYVAFNSIGKYFYAVLSLVYAVLAIGVIRLRTRALDAMIALQGLFLINGLLSIASPTYLHTLQDTMQRNAMTNPALPNGLPFLSYSFLRWAMIGGVAFSSAVLGVLVGFRDRFRKAAAETGS